MRARLVCKTRPGTSIDRTFEDRLDIVRGGDGRNSPNVLALDNELISSAHATIEWDSGARAFVLIDKDSSNGTALDDVPVRGSRVLDGVHVISLAGEYDFVFAPVDATARAPVPVPAADAEAAATRAAPRTELRPPPGPFVVPPSAANATIRPPDLRPIVPPGNGLRIEIRLAGRPTLHALVAVSYRIGRLPDNEIVIDHPTVSKRHAQLDVESDRVVLRHLSQNSQTFVDGVAVQEAALRRGTQVFFGEVEAVLM